MSNSLKSQLSYLVDLRIPGFEKSVPPGTIRQLSFSPRRSEEWFEEFIGRVSGAIGNHYLPVYRMADGEFMFAVGYHMPFREPGASPIKHFARQLLSYLLLRRLGSQFFTVHGECYTRSQRNQQYPLYVSYLRQISEQGILAMFLAKQRDNFALQYVSLILDWLDAQQILVKPENYYPFYFVYALLNGPERRRIYSGKRILIVTSTDDEKREAIEHGLQEAGAIDTQFIQISRNKALLDKISLAGIDRPVDVVLVGAGIGAANILVQLRELNTLCIDAGFCIDLLASSSLAGRRYFTLRDNPENL